VSNADTANRLYLGPRVKDKVESVRYLQMEMLKVELPQVMQRFLKTRSRSPKGRQNIYYRRGVLPL